MNTRSTGEKTGMTYLGTTPSLVKGSRPPPRKQAEVLCHCPQKCDSRVPKDVRQWFFTQFQSVDDRCRQNAWLVSQIEMRSVYRRLWSPGEQRGGTVLSSGGTAKLQRRVSCKYRVPTSLPLRLFPTVCGKVDTVEVCMKAFMNVYGVTEKRIRLQRERMISELRRQTSDDVALELASLEALSAASIDTVDSFFINQLWKPEYVTVKETKQDTAKRTPDADENTTNDNANDQQPNSNEDEQATNSDNGLTPTLENKNPTTNDLTENDDGQTSESTDN